MSFLGALIYVRVWGFRVFGLLKEVLASEFLGCRFVYSPKNTTVV